MYIAMGASIEGLADAVLGVLTDLSNLAVFSQDVDGRITTWNRGAALIFGYSMDELVGQPLHLLVPPHQRSHLDAIFNRIITGEKVDRVFTEIRRQDGMPVPIALSLAPVVDRKRQCVGTVGVAQELTEIRLAQAALGEVETRLREWESFAHVGRWLWDTGTDAVQWSDQLHRMHAVDPRDFDGTLEAHLSVMHVEDRGVVRALLYESVATGQSFAGKYRIVLDDGSTRYFSMRADPAVGSSGEVVGVRGVSHDETIVAVKQ